MVLAVYQSLFIMSDPQTYWSPSKNQVLMVSIS